MRRWTLTDPVAFETYSFDANPNDFTLTYKRPVTVKATTAADGAPIMFQGVPELDTAEIKGVALTKLQYETFVAWTKKNYLVTLADDLGQSWVGRVESFVPVRSPWRHFPYRFTYTLTYRVLGT